jgi:hypothetical protein
MRKLFFVYVLGFFASRMSFGATMDVGGEVNVFTKISSKPSAKRGQVAFVLPSTLLNVDATLDGQNSVFIELQLSSERDNFNQKLPADLAKVFYQWISEGQEVFFRYGLFRNFINENDSEIYNYDFFDELKMASRRFKYLPDADLGIEVHYLFSDFLSIGMGISNGEENKKEESGNQKDNYLVLDYNDSVFNLGIMYMDGSYDDYEKPFNLKERWIMKLGWNFGFLKMGLEALRTQDAAIGVSQYHRAEGWDSTAFPEQVISGEGGSLWLKFEVGEEKSLLFKGDFFDPNLSQKEDEIKSYQAFFEITKDARSGFLGYSFTSYGQNHSKYSPEKEFAFVGVRQLF